MSHEEEKLQTHERLTHRPLRLRRQVQPRMQLHMVPMIDVVFLLLVFFLLAVNFRSKEGFLPAELPQQITLVEQMEMEPLLLYLTTLPDGACQVQIGSEQNIIITHSVEQGTVLEGEPEFARLGRAVLEVLDQQGRNLDDPVKLIPTRQTKWDHLVKTYDALWQIDLRNIIFAMVD